MKIVHFLLGRCNPDSANGVDKYVYYITRAQASLGLEVALFCLTDKAPIPVPGVLIKCYRRPRFPFNIPSALKHDIRAWSPEIVHLHSTYIPANARLGAWLRHNRINYVITPHGGLAEPVLLGRHRHLKSLYRAFEELPLLNSALFVHSVGDIDQIRAYGVRSPIAVVPPGYAEVPSTRQAGPTLRERIPELNGKQVFLFVGRLDAKGKGLELFLRAFATANPSNAAVVLVGPDWKGGRAILTKLARTLGVSSRVWFQAPLFGQEKYDTLLSADVFVHTSPSEGLSNAVLEACALGMPCLLTKAADPLGLLSKHDAAVVVEHNCSAVASGIMKLAQMNVSDLRRCGERARALVAANFNWQKTATSLTELYGSFGNSPQPPSASSLVL